MGLPLTRNSRWIRAIALGLAALLLIAACSPGASDTEGTTDEPTGTAAAGSTASTVTTTPETSAASTATTSTTRPTTTTTRPTTTTTRPTTTTTRPTTTTTTLAIPPDNEPPTVEIISPADLSSHIAVLDDTGLRFGAAVSLSAVVSDPNGDDYTVEWFSSDEGSLGTGESIVAVLHTGQFDSAQPIITARATDQWGAVNESTIQIIVWIPSDV